MNKERQKELIEIVLYILKMTGGLDFYHVFKILYFAQKDFLANWGRRLIFDDFCALENGPVPTSLYDVVKGQDPYKSQGLLSLYNEVISKAGEDAPNFLIALRDPDMDYISDAAREILDKAISTYAYMSFGTLKRESHDTAWKEAFEAGTGAKKMSLASIAKASTDNSAMIDYINENEMLSGAFL